MTSEIEGEQESKADATADQLHEYSRDWLLCNIVSMFNRTAEKTSMGITLHLGGLIVSGQMIGGREYFELYGDFWADNFAGEDADEIRAHYSSPAELYGPEGSSSNDPSFIHLKNAKAFMGGGNPIPNNQGVLWRGKIASVDAFYFGTLEVA